MRPKALTYFLAILGLALFLFGYASAIKPGEPIYEKGEGKLLSADGYKFDYVFYPSQQKGPSIIYIPGMGGRTSYTGQGGYILASPLNKAGFNFIGFDRFDAIPINVSTSLQEQIDRTSKRAKSEWISFPTFDGKESASENIVRNEVVSLIRFIEGAPTHDVEKGIYLIGSSVGSWISLVAVQMFPEKIRGVVFLSPAIIPRVFAEIPKTSPNINVTQYTDSLFKAYGNRPGLAIGSKRDILNPYTYKDQSSLDGARYLRERIGPNIEITEDSSSSHGEQLIVSNRQIRERIVVWLTYQTEKK